jgi:hypothetical protein
MPVAIRDHLIQRMRDRQISVDDLNRLRVWLESMPEVPDETWYKDFGSFQALRQGPVSENFLLAGQVAVGKRL